MPRFQHVMLSLALVLLVQLCYREAPAGSFHFDDTTNVTERPAIQVEALSLARLKTALAGAFIPRRPLSNLTLALDWRRGRGSPRAFLQTNVVIHASATLALYALLLTVLTFGRPRASSSVTLGAFAAAALWAAHPLQSQAVVYVVQRMASLAALLCFVSVAAYLRGREGGARRAAWFVLSGVAFLLACLCKENAWLTPLLVVLAELGVVRRRGPLLRGRLERVALALFALGCLYVVVDLTAGLWLYQRFNPTYAYRDFTMGERLLTQPRVIAFHLSQLVWPDPSRFSLLHDFTPSRSLVSPPSTAAALAGVLAWLAAGGWLLGRSRQRVAGFLLLWVPVALIPESTFVGLEMVYEHRMYLPGAGLAGLLALGIARLARGRSRRVRRSVLVLLIATAAVLVWATRARVPVWRDDLTLWSSVVKAAPGSARAQNNLGEALRGLERHREAFERYQKAVSLDPSDYRAVNNLGRSLSRFGQKRRAEALFRRSIELHPEFPNSHFSLGMCYLEQRRYRGAQAQFMRTLELDPSYPQAQLFLGFVRKRLDGGGPGGAGHHGS